jgi:hypothetical protein
MKHSHFEFLGQKQIDLTSQKSSLKVIDNDSLLEQKLELATQGLEPHILGHLKTKVSPDNALTISKYILSMKVETSLTIFIRFFKWLYYQSIEPSKRPKPHTIRNLSLLKRKEQSIYKPSDLWTAEDDLLFLRYCFSKRIKCFHAMSSDMICRPHELLKHQSTGNRQYAEVLVSGKTGSRNIPLIDVLPYIKDFPPTIGIALAVLVIWFDYLLDTVYHKRVDANSGFRLQDQKLGCHTCPHRH